MVLISINTYNNFKNLQEQIIDSHRVKVLNDFVLKDTI